jgi:CheY-like chemotaxis protein
MASKKILVVDDYRDSRKMVVKLLQSNGIDADFFEAIHAENAIELLSEESIDLIISDLMMPGLNGVEFIEKVKKEELSQCDFILMTASLDNLHKVKSGYDVADIATIETSELFVKLVPEVKKLVN